MATKYTSQTISGYDANPPPDDGTTGDDNKVTWAKHKTKLGNPIKTLAEAINTALVAHVDVTPLTKSTNYTTIESDDLRTIECTGSPTITLGLAATMGAGYIVRVKNTSTGTVTVQRGGSDTIEGVATSRTLIEGEFEVYEVNAGETGYHVIGEGSAAISGALLAIEIFTADGTWTKPTGTNAVEVEAIGGGASGTGITGSATLIKSAEGGGAGAYAYGYITSGLGATETVTIGQGGAGVLGDGNGNAGTDSSFGAHIVAGGGALGLGGTASGTGLTLGISGDGGEAITTLTTPTASIPFMVANRGGVAHKYGTQIRNTGFSLSGTPLAGSGQNAEDYGCGGEGAIARETTSQASGGNGSNGIVIVKSYG